MLAARRALIRPKAVLFDLFHTLTYVPKPETVGEPAVSDILGISAEEFHRLYYDEDVFGRAVGRVRDSVEAMRLVAHAIDPTIDEQRILAAVESRRRRFDLALLKVETGVLEALDRLRARGIRTAIVSDAGHDD